MGARDQENKGVKVPEIDLSVSDNYNIAKIRDELAHQLNQWFKKHPSVIYF
jgi:hypothetical protein